VFAWCETDEGLARQSSQQILLSTIESTRKRADSLGVHAEGDEAMSRREEILSQAIVGITIIAALLAAGVLCALT
jgi:hypothetical protein